MSRAGISTGGAVLLAVALAVGPAPAGQATRAVDARADTHTVPSDRHQAQRSGPQAQPSVRRLSPSSGTTDGGTDVVVKGRNLSGVTKVLFGGGRATHVTVKSPHKLIAQTPAHAPGSVQVRVVTKQGRSAKTKASRFEYETPPPVVTAVAPRAGPTAGGTAVALTGSGLAGATGVRFGSAKATSFRVDSASRITATTPGRVAGPVDITVTTAGGSTEVADAFTYVVPPTLSSASPDTGPTSGATVTLTGSGFTAATAVTFGGVAASDVTVLPGGNQLTATTPGHSPGWVDVSVTTAGGSATLTHGFLYVGGTSLTGASPSVGPAAGGVNVTLTGGGFTAETLVVFGNKPSLEVVVNPAGTSLTALLPAHPAGPVDVGVSTVGDSATLTDGFTYVDAPTLTSASPVAGPTTGGTTVTLTGTGFQAGTQVSFGGAAATGVSVSPGGTQLTAVAPAHAAGAVDVSVTTVGGTATLPAAYTYVVAPSLASVSPQAGPATGGTIVTLTGSGFRAGMQVSFGGQAATAVNLTSTTSATATAPAHPAGAVSVSVTTPGGTASLSNAYTYVDAPTLTSLTPTAGPVDGGMSVTLTGSGFRTGMQVMFGGVDASVTSIPSSTQATVTTPAQAAGTVGVSVTTPGGSATLPAAYTYVVAPLLGSVSPTTGPTTGGTTVTLTGSGFRAGIQVAFGGVPAAVLSVSPGGTQLTATTPAHAAGAVSVSVSTPGGSDTLSNAYTYVVAPTLTDVTPNAGPLAGGTTVTLTGTGFRDGMQVLFGTTPATGVSVNPDGTQLTAVTPPHAAGPVDLAVGTPGGSATLANGYTYLASPTVTGVSPDAGPVSGGTTVTLTGSGFRPGMQVLFGATPATGVSVQPGGTQLTVVSPAHVAAAVDVSVSTPGGSAVLGNSFTFVAAPVVVSVSPAQGPAAGGTSLTVTGSSFRSGMQVLVGGVPATGIVVNPAGTQFTATAPSHAPGTVGVSVSTPGGSDTLPSAFTFVAAPTLTSISPAAGPAVGATTVTLSGNHLTGTSGATFDGVSATDLVVVDDQTVTVTTPAHAAGAVDVEVTTVGGSANAVGGFTYVAAPTLTAVTPDTGAASGGETVTLTGNHLTGTAGATFDGVPGTDLVVVDDQTVTVTTPAHAAGAVDVEVTTVGGSATAVGAYTFVAAPTLTAVTPDTGPAAGGDTVTLTGTALTSTSGVTFDGVPAANLVVVDDQTVTVTTPSHAVGAVDVAVTTGVGTATALGAYTYEP